MTYRARPRDFAIAPLECMLWAALRPQQQPVTARERLHYLLVTRPVMSDEQGVRILARIHEVVLVDREAILASKLATFATPQRFSYAVKAGPAQRTRSVGVDVFPSTAAL